MRTGRIFRRCSKCTKPFPRIQGKRAQRCPDHPKSGSSWTYSVDVNASGEKRRRKTKGGFASEADAKADMDVVLGIFKRTGSYAEPSRMTLGDYVAEWHEGRRHDIKASTHTMQGTQVRKHLEKGSLSEVPLRSLTAPMIRQWETDLIDTGLTGKTVSNLHGLLGVALRDAVDDGLLITNPMPNRRPKVAKPNLTRLTPSDIGTFLRAVDGDTQPWVGVYYLMVAMTAMRRSEALAIKWSDFVTDDDGNTLVTIERTLSEVVDGQPTFSTTKTEGIRTVGVPRGVIEKLRAYRKKQVPAMSGLVFTHADGSPVNPELATRTFRRLWDAVPELPRAARLHDLRHGWVTTRIAAGDVTTKELADQLGHTDGRMIEAVYGFIDPAVKTASAQAVADAIGM